MTSKKLFLIDGHALCYRSFFAIRELTNSRGESTNAVYGFVNTLRKILRNYNPTHCAVIFDAKGKTKREEKFEKYKIQRPSMPEGLSSQIPIIKEVVDAFAIPQYELKGYEADDLIGVITKKATAQKIDVVVATDDKDLFQLANKNVTFYSFRKDEIRDEQAVEKRYGFSPEFITDYLALAGDTADNIPGVKGVGEKTATTLIQSFGSVESIYDNLANVEKESVRKKLEASKDNAFLSKELATLEFEAPIEFALNDMSVEPADNKKLYDLFQNLEFKRLALEYAEETVSEAPVLKRKDVSGAKAIKDVITLAQKKGQVALYLEQAEDSLFSQMYVNIGSKDVYVFSDTMIADLKPLWTDKKVTKIVHNSKALYKQLLSLGISPQGEIFDILLVGFLLQPGRSDYKPSDLSWKYLDQQVQENVDGADQAYAAYQLYAVLKKDLKNQSLEKLYDSIEGPLALTLAKVENAGVCLDEAFLKELGIDCQKRIDALTKVLYKQAGEEFNLNSPKQLSVILFEKLELPVIKKTKTGFSTDEGVLTKLAQEHEFPAHILEYRQLAKLKSTYIDALPKLVDGQTHKIHAEFNQIGAETGRLSSRHPNLQNIPIRTELGRQIRKSIIASKDQVLVAADYSQIELRVLAHLSEDKALLKAFNDDEDIHTYTASLIFDQKLKDIDYHMRDTAKRVNFGIVYGMSGFGLAKDLKISQKEAQDFIDRYFSRYPKVKDFMNDQIAHAQEHGYVKTLLNRRRYIPEINSRNNAVKQFAERQAINTPVQGSAADLMKIAMIDVQEKLEKSFESKMISTVHDELIFDVIKKEEKDLIQLVRDSMQNAMTLKVPIKVDVKVGQNWLEMKEV